MGIRDRAVPVDPRLRPTPDDGRRGATWLVLASDGPAARLGADAPGRRVRVLANPRRFRDVLLAERPSIVVCAQPPAGARELGLVVAERRRRAGLRAVLLAPPEAVSERLAALALGFDDALLTTTPVAELAGRLALLEAGARREPHTDTVVFVAPGLELDHAAHLRRRDGAVVHLRPKEFGLLAMLAGRPGLALSRRQLIDGVWGSGHQGGARTVDVHVRWLRSKIEPDPGHPVHLVTVWGVGYRLDAPSALTGS
jgi:two-component system response regulator RegX3